MNRPDPLERRVRELNSQVDELRSQNEALRKAKAIPAARPKHRGELDKKSAKDIGGHAGHLTAAGAIVMIIYAIFEEGRWPIGSEHFWTAEAVNTGLLWVVSNVLFVLHKLTSRFD